ncbi:MAG: family 10 glycosylhydrolase [Muribaculaceae bacterium]|nr:family 10 glycosylhydrolase [Muribaculaceae bacterium]
MKKLSFFLAAALVALTATVSCKHSETAADQELRIEDRPKIMWLDFSANWAKFSNPDTARYYIKKAADCGFNHLVVDVKGTKSVVAYNSEIAPRVKSWKGVDYPENFDYLDTMITIGRENGMKVLASVNMFCEGTDPEQGGILNGDRKDWETVYYFGDGTISKAPDMEGPATAFMNPALPEVQDYARSLVLELVKNYDLDGVMLDRCRYEGMRSDFSDFSKKKFEEYIGEQVENFPQDIFEWVPTENGGYTRKPGKWHNKWIEWRASVIHDFFAETRDSIKAVKPDMMLGNYTGAWYPSYYEVGVNWASKDYDPSKDFDWATPEYKNYALNELFDFYTNGNYYVDVTLDELHAHGGRVKNETDSEWSTGDHLCVEGACEFSRKLLGDRPFYGGMYVEQYYGDPDRFQRAVKMNLEKSDGFMLFDMCHIIAKDWFDILGQAIAEAEDNLRTQQSAEK